MHQDTESALKNAVEIAKKTGDLKIAAILLSTLGAAHTPGNWALDALFHASGELSQKAVTLLINEKLTRNN